MHVNTLKDIKVYIHMHQDLEATVHVRNHLVCRGCVHTLQNDVNPDLCACQGTVTVAESYSIYRTSGYTKRCSMAPIARYNRMSLSYIHNTRYRHIMENRVGRWWTPALYRHFATRLFFMQSEHYGCSRHVVGDFLPEYCTLELSVSRNCPIDVSSTVVAFTGGKFHDRKRKRIAVEVAEFLHI